MFVSHSAAGDHAACGLRDALEKRLSGDFEVLLDKRLLAPGDRWRGAVHRWLGTCDAAVAILTPKALQSGWVLKELTILTWRQSLGGRPPIIPILSGCTPEQVADHVGFRPLQLDENQFLVVGSPSSSEEVVAEVESRVRALAPIPDTSPLHDWVQRVASLLAAADAPALDAARRSLSVDDVDWARFDQREVTLAHRLLHSTLAEAESALYALEPGLRIREDFAALVALVIPVWVPELPARQLGDVTRRPFGRRVAFVPARYQETVKDCVLRSTFGRTYESDFLTVTGVAGGDPERELFAAYRRCLQEELDLADRPVERVARLLNDEESRRKYLLVAGATPSGVVEALRSEYGGAVLVLHGEAVPGASAVDRVDVALGIADEDEIDQHRKELQRLCRARR